VALGVSVWIGGPLAGSVAAADTLALDARVLLGGQARIGSWMAISVHLRNDGPAVAGELRLSGGAQSQTRFGTAVDLPTQSDKTYLLYAQPPSFGTQVDVLLVDGDRTIATTTARYTSHEATQTVVAVVAEHPERIIADVHLPADLNGVAPAVVGMSPDELPDRVEAWGTLDRIVWQDVDAGRLTDGQLAALRGWVAAGGRLVVAGGTLGPRVLGAFPDILLPYRPSTTTDIPTASLAALLGPLGGSAPATVPALSGELAAGRALATSGDRVVAAERPYGAGSVTLLGFDPSADWVASSDAAERLWRRVLPVRTTAGTGLAFPDDNLLVSAVGQLPSLALPSIGGLIVLLGAYIVLIGPINYVVLKRLERREWAWVTMPVLILAFAGGAYAIGAALRGSEVIVNEVAIVRGAPGATDGAAQVYLGIFSPSRNVYQVRLPGGALLSAPVNGDPGGSGTTLDVLQGDPSRVRNLAVGFGSLRAIRAETAVDIPLIDTDLQLVDGHLRGTIRNTSTQTLEQPAVVLGSTVATLKDLAPGAEQAVDVPLDPTTFGQSLADRVVGPTIFDTRGAPAGASRQYVRHNMVDQLSWDQMMGSTNRLPADGPVVLAWGSGDLVPVEIEGQRPNRIANVLYYLPTRLTITGLVTFRSDLITATLVESDAMLFPKDPSMVTFGRGTATYAYRPVAFDGRLTATRLTVGFNVNDPAANGDPVDVAPLPKAPPAQPDCADPPPATCKDGGGVLNPGDGIPEVDLFDLESRTWRRLPHLTMTQRSVVADPARFVDPASGTVLVRYVNERQDPIGAVPEITITGTVQ
jgi:hypothetical protein